MNADQEVGASILNTISMKTLKSFLKNILGFLGQFFSARERAIKKEYRLMLLKFKETSEKAFESGLRGIHDTIEFQEIVKSVANATKKKLESFFPKITIFNARLDEIVKEQQVSLDEMREQEKRRIMPTVYASIFKVLASIIPAQDRLNVVRTKITLLRAKARVSNGALRRMIVDTPKAIFVSLVIINILEVIFSTATFESMGYWQITGALIAFGLSLMLGYSALMTAKSYHEFETRKAIAWLSIGSFIVSILNIARIREGLDIFPGLILIALFATSIMLMLAYLKNKEHFDIVDELLKTEREEAQLETFIFGQKNLVIQLHLEGVAQIEEAVQGRVTQNKQDYSTYYLALEAEQARLDTALDFVDTLKDSALAYVAQLHSEGLSSTTFRDDMFNDSEPASEAKNFWRNAAMTLITIIAFSSLSSCSIISDDNNNDDDHISIFINTDETESIPEGQTTAKSVYDFIVNEKLNLDEEPIISSRVDVHLSHISDSSLPTIVTVSLSKGSHRLLTNGPSRKKEIESFKLKLMEAIEQNFEAKPTKSRTIIYRNILNQFEMLRQVKGHKSMILITDFMEEGSITFTAYEEAPERLRNEAEKIRELFEKQSSPLGDLTGIDIYMVYTTHGNGEDLLYYSRMFFYDWFKDAGASTSLRPNF